MEDLEELKKTNKLTPRQEMFCQEYVTMGVASRAYAKVYNFNYQDPKDNLKCRVQASQLLTNPNVKSRVEELREQARQQSIIDRQMLLDASMEILLDARKGTPEMKMNRDGKFVPTGNMIQDHKGANEAIKNIMRMLGLDTQIVNANVEGKADINIATAKDFAKELMGDD